MTQHRFAISPFRQALPDGHSPGVELAESKARLGQAQEHLLTTLRSIRQGIMIFGPDGQVHLCNARAVELLQLPAHFAEDAIDLSDVAAVLTATDVSLGADGQSASMRRGDGQVISIQLNRLTGVMRP